MPEIINYYTSRYSGEQIDNLLTGLSFEIGGSYANLAAIQAAFPNGDTHAYQAQDTGNIYVWNAETHAWESVGQLQGPIGPAGPQGAAAGFGAVTASVSSTVGTPTVTVTSSGPDTAKNFNFSFRNLKGDRGQKGDKGNKGDKGDRGPQGIQGPRGYQGQKGDQGIQGVEGPQGPQGIAGPRGPQGEAGPVGPQGPQGVQGPQGIAGVAVSAAGIYAFNVNDDGHLILSYTGDNAPDFFIDSNGHLILNL